MNVETDTTHCGGCNTTCPAPTNGVATCVAQKCGVQCNAGLATCSGACVDTASDRSNCGTCGHKCVGNHVCTSGVCTH